MKRFLKSVSFALNGIRAVFKSERNFKIHIVAMVIVILMGLYLEISSQTWGLVIFSIGFVLIAELFNTAVERLGDETSNGKQRQRVKNAKDISAGAVLISALTALTIGIIFLLVPFVQRILALI
jgi:diacylglycerol kinase